MGLRGLAIQCTGTALHRGVHQRAEGGRNVVKHNHVNVYSMYVSRLKFYPLLMLSTSENSHS